MADLGAGIDEFFAAAGKALAGVLGAGALAEVEGVLVAVDELAGLLDAVEDAVEEAVGSLDGAVLVGIGRPGEGDEDADPGQFVRDGADPLGAALAQDLGCVLAQGELEVGGAFGIATGVAGIGSPAVLPGWSVSGARPVQPERSAWEGR